MNTHTYTIDKRCKHSTRYAADADSAPMQTIYVRNDWLQEHHGQIPEQLTVGVADALAAPLQSIPAGSGGVASTD